MAGEFNAVGQGVGRKKEEWTGPRVDHSSPSVQEARLCVLLGIWKADTKHVPWQDSSAPHLHSTFAGRMSPTAFLRLSVPIPFPP